MQLVDRHVIRNTSPFWAEIDDLAFRSKNLFNQANYQIRQRFIFQRKYLNYNYMAAALKDSPDYKALPAKVSQQILMRLDESWRSFFTAIKEWNVHPEKFLGRPKLPKYKDKKKGRNVLTYTIQAISQKWLKQGWINLPMTNVFIKVLYDNVRQVRIVPKCDHYVIEVVYEKEAKDLGLNPASIASLDLGVSNLAALTSNQPGFQPVLINGRPLKSTNQYFNKVKARLQSLLPGHRKTSHKIRKLTSQRNYRVDHYLHNASRWIIDYLIQNDIGTLVIGKNDLWKNGINIGKQNNQQFVQIPHGRFVQQLTYKAQLVGIQVIAQEESYTSKASFMDGDAIPVYQKGSEAKHRFSGRRIARGLYRTANGFLINADVNGSYNILRKAFPVNGIEAVVVQPVRVTPGKG
ncbi:MAG: transposase [Leptolyngbya sp. LCM1.Bin17]|nr:MAG: transposase [Leptolyngbya sp. LCM1.Bin17]